VRADLERAGAPVRLLPRRLPKFDPSWVLKLRRAMRGDGVSLVHTHLFGDSLHGYLAARMAGGLPMIMTLHGRTEVLNRLQILGYRWLLARTRAVACSRSTEASFHATGWRGAAQIVTIPNGIEPAPAPAGDSRLLRAALGLEADAVVFGCVGRLSPEKGYDRLIRAFAVLANGATPGPTPRRQLVILGEGPLRKDLEKLAEREGVAERVIFAGFHPNVRELLPALDVVVASSLSEGLSVALLEAMAAGRCIVGTDVPGIREAVSADREALIVPADDVESLSRALGRVAHDPTLRERLGAAARRRFGVEFTAARMVESYETLYRSVQEQRQAALC
jgi:glycosyltransferase involved in cell wall biosynthesis